MKKILLLILFVVLSRATFSQSTEIPTNNDELIIMTKEKHEALRRDIQDYKLLLVKYQSLRIEQDILTADIERQSKLLDSKNDKYLDALKRIEGLERDIDYIRKKLEEANITIAQKEKDYNNLKRMYYTSQGKVVQMKKDQAGVYVWRGLAVFFFLAMLLVGSQ